MKNQSNEENQENLTTPNGNLTNHFWVKANKIMSAMLWASQGRYFHSISAYNLLKEKSDIKMTLSEYCEYYELLVAKGYIEIIEVDYRNEDSKFTNKALLQLVHIGKMILKEKGLI